MIQKPKGRELQIKGTKVLKKTKDAFEGGSKLVLHQGGSRSSKTWSIFQWFLIKAIAGEEISVTIVRDKLTWIKSTLIKDFQELHDLYGFPVTPVINPNRSEQIYNVNGSEFAFYGLDYAEKLHGRTQDWFWMNEVMEIGRKHFDQLEMRTKVGGILDYNPYDDLHWVFDLHKRPDVAVIHSTMLDNPFLPQTMRDKIYSYKPTPENIERGTADNYSWQVYGLGKKARLEGVVFENWDIVDKIPDGAELLGYGLDFGFSNDPTALIGVYKYDSELYFDELLYQAGLTNQDIAEKLEELGIKDWETIVGDSSEPKSIEEIRRAGFNIKPAKKGSDSIRYGIDLMNTFKKHITKRSVNTENEFRKYKWAEDRNGKRLQVPIDDFNHAIDSIRYLVSLLLGQEMELQFFDRDRLGF